MQGNNNSSSAVEAAAVAAAAAAAATAVSGNDADDNSSNNSTSSAHPYGHSSSVPMDLHMPQPFSYYRFVIGVLQNTAHISVCKFLCSSLKTRSKIWKQIYTLCISSSIKPKCDAL